MQENLSNNAYLDKVKLRNMNSYLLKLYFKKVYDIEIIDGICHNIVFIKNIKKVAEFFEKFFMNSKHLEWLNLEEKICVFSQCIQNLKGMLLARIKYQIFEDYVMDSKELEKIFDTSQFEQKAKIVRKMKEKKNENMKLGQYKSAIMNYNFEIASRLEKSSDLYRKSLTQTFDKYKNSYKNRENAEHTLIQGLESINKLKLKYVRRILS